MSWVRRRILFPLILVVVLAVVTFLLFEVIIRASAPFSPFVRLLTRSEVALPEAETLAEFLDLHGVGFHPGRAMGGRYRNSFGLQSAEPSPQATRRIVVIGDSFVVNDYPVGWMWPQLLQEALTDADEPALDVLTFGLPGIGPGDYEQLWDLAGRRLEPDQLVVSFFVGNDFQNFRELRNQAPPRFRTTLFFRNLWRFLRNRATRSGGASAPAGPGPPRADGIGQVGMEVPGYEESYVNRQPSIAEPYYRALKSEVLNVFSVENQDLLQTEVLRVAEILRRICAKAGQSGTQCFVVIFPDELQVDTQLRQSLLEALDRETEAFDFDLPSAALADRLESFEIPAIELRSCLRGHRSTLFRPRDTHLNARGNLLAAMCIAEELNRASRQPVVKVNE